MPHKKPNSRQEHDDEVRPGSATERSAMLRRLDQLEMQVDSLRNALKEHEPQHSDGKVDKDQNGNTQKDSTSGLLANRLEAFCAATSFHGLPYVWQANGLCGRLLWTCLFIACLCAMMPPMVTVIEEYTRVTLNWGTDVYESDAREGMAYEEHGLEFPTITICGFNRVNVGRLKTMNMSEDALNALLRSMPDHHPIRSNRAHADASSIFEYLEQNQLTRDKLIEALAPTCEETIVTVTTLKNLTQRPISAWEGGGFCSLSFAAGDAADVSYEHSRTLGRCIAIHFDRDTIRVNRAGHTGGISLLLDTHSEDYVPIVVDNYLDFGFLVRLDFGYRNTGGRITVSPGFHSWIGMQQRRITYRQSTDWLPVNDRPPYCVHQASLKSLSDSLYTMEICKHDCELYEIAQQCGCVPSVLESDKYKECDLKANHCANTASRNIEEQPSVAECRRQCKPLCRDKKADVTVSMNRILSPMQKPKFLEALKKVNYRNLRNNLSDTIVDRNFALVDIYYRTLSVTVVERFKRHTASDLLSQIGGQLGLFLGASIITVVHMIVQGVSAIVDLVKTLANKPK